MPHGSVEREIDDIVRQRPDGRRRPVAVGGWVRGALLDSVSSLGQDRVPPRPSRVVAVSRGGAGSWYEGIAGRYVEMWDEIDPAEFARRTAERGATKQLEISDFDRDVIRLVETAAR